uniref:ORF2L n=1 Tax=Planaria asexual strain-specific virus-like element type 2 TaxID=159253 RepID=Q91S68_9VIRU|nr:ORF2L [Planaria asexual strain-specific virus-like element type 2]
MGIRRKKVTKTVTPKRTTQHIQNPAYSGTPGGPQAASTPLRNTPTRTPPTKTTPIRNRLRSRVVGRNGQAVDRPLLSYRGRGANFGIMHNSPTNPRNIMRMQPRVMVENILNLSNYRETSFGTPTQTPRQTPQVTPRNSPTQPPIQPPNPEIPRPSQPIINKNTDGTGPGPSKTFNTPPRTPITKKKFKSPKSTTKLLPKKYKIPKQNIITKKFTPPITKQYVPFKQPLPKINYYHTPFLPKNTQYQTFKFISRSSKVINIIALFAQIAYEIYTYIHNQQQYEQKVFNLHNKVKYVINNIKNILQNLNKQRNRVNELYKELLQDHKIVAAIKHIVDENKQAFSQIKEEHKTTIKQHGLQLGEYFWIRKITKANTSQYVNKIIELIQTIESEIYYKTMLSIDEHLKTMNSTDLYKYIDSQKPDNTDNYYLLLHVAQFYAKNKYKLHHLHEP